MLSPFHYSALSSAGAASTAGASSTTASATGASSTTGAASSTTGAGSSAFLSIKGLTVSGCFTTLIALLIVTIDFLAPGIPPLIILYNFETVVYRYYVMSFVYKALDRGNAYLAAAGNDYFHTASPKQYSSYYTTVFLIFP